MPPQRSARRFLRLGSLLSVNVPSLVLVHRQQLLDQWRERLAMFLELPVEQIGQIGGGKTKRTGRVDVAVIQSLYQEQAVKDFVAEYGHIVVDECHHLSAFTFEKVMREVKARYVVGLPNCSRMKLTKPPEVANGPMYPFRYSRSRHSTSKLTWPLRSSGILAMTRFYGIRHYAGRFEVEDLAS